MPPEILMPPGEKKIPCIQQLINYFDAKGVFTEEQKQKLIEGGFVSGDRWTEKQEEQSEEDVFTASVWTKTTSNETEFDNGGWIKLGTTVAPGQMSRSPNYFREAPIAKLVEPQPWFSEGPGYVEIHFKNMFLSFLNLFRRKN